MNIGLLTVPFNNNYGGFLQAYALKSLFEAWGHHVTIINRRRNRKSSKFYQYIRHILFLDKANRKYKKISGKTEAFRRKYLYPETSPYYTTLALQESESLGLDFFVVGSDQVWRYDYAKPNIEDYFFGFLSKNQPRISYAASFGVSPSGFDHEKKELCSALLTKFKAVSVRESSAISILESEFGVPKGVVKHVLDPTFLIDKGYYERLSLSEKELTGDYLFSYVLDETSEVQQFVERVTEQTALPVSCLKAQTGSMENWKEIEPVELWLNRIIHSKYVITDSFHGMVFSIIFNKEFIVIANRSRGIDRFTSILSILGLEDHLVTDVINQKPVFRPVDWEPVNNILQEKRAESIQFLTTALSNEK